MQATAPPLTSTPVLEIYTRPEIRKGCVWDIQLRFAPDFVSKHNVTHLYAEKPRSATDSTYYLCLKIRSKLIKPIREIPFNKVATTVCTEDNVLHFTDMNTAVLKVKFTARPRAVFHKHSDMMILLVSVKKGERVIASSEAELVFRGGTGSIHSAETRKLMPTTFNQQPAGAQTPQQQPPQPQQPPQLIPQPPTSVNSSSLYSLSHPPPPTILAQTPAKPVPTETTASSALPVATSYHPPPPSSSADINLTSSVSPVLEFEDFDSHQFCNDFLQNKGDALLSFNAHHHSYSLGGGYGGGSGFEDLLMSPDPDFTSQLWGEPLFPEVVVTEVKGSRLPVRVPTTEIKIDPLTTATTLSNDTCTSNNSNTYNNNNTTMTTQQQHNNNNNNIQNYTQTHNNNNNEDNATNDAIVDMEIPNEFTTVHGKRRGSCLRCHLDCTCYKGSGGPCSECGCFPAIHYNLDNPQASTALKRKLEMSEECAGAGVGGSGGTEEPPSKRPRYLLEVKYFQKLFFSCLQYMNLSQISSVCSRAPVPIFVKDSNSTYIYINPTFFNFIIDISQAQQVLNQNTLQVLDQRDAEFVIKQENYLMAQEEGTIKTFDVPVRREVFSVMKQWTKLPDGRKVIIGVVVSSP